MQRRFSRRQTLAGAGGAAGFATLSGCKVGRTERLKITRVEMFRVVVPMQDDIINSPEFGPDGLTEFPAIPKFILKVHTDSGIVGIGETNRGVPEVQVRRDAEAVVGTNIFDYNLAGLRLPTGPAENAFEQSFYDAVGKAVGWPVYRLLGGLAQRKILVNYWCGRKNPTDMGRVAQRAMAGSFEGIKIKGQPGDPVVKSVEAIAAVAPALKITVDFNACHKDLREFLPIGEGLDRIGNVRVIEDPITKSDFEGYRELRRRLKTPIALHLNDARSMIRAIRADACQVINTGGHMANFVSNSYMAEAAAIPVWHSSSHDLGIFDASYLHACAAAPNCTLPSDIVSYQRVDDLIVHPIEIRNSFAIVNDRPGLGVELDEDAVRRYQIKS